MAKKASGSDLDAALKLFNERLATSARQEQAARRVAKAERAKDEAARHLKKVQQSDTATSDEVAEAEARYRDAAVRWQTLREGGEPDQAADHSSIDETAEVSGVDAAEVDGVGEAAQVAGPPVSDD